MQHILLVEDDPEISMMVSGFMTDHGFRVSRASDGRAVDRVLAAGKPDLVLLDLMLPGEDGLSICRRLRMASSVPILLVTALGSEADKVLGLELGADDYIVKPFSSRELLARVRAVLRREERATAPADDSRLIREFDGWQLNPARRTLHAPNGLRVALTSGEFGLLVVLCNEAGWVLSRDQLLSLLHGRSVGPFDRSIDIQISRLRRKIETDPKGPTLIKTVRNGGYMFTPEVRLLAEHEAVSA